MSEFLFTSESVSAGHPDKIADQISDAVLDAALRETIRAKQDPKSVRVACETLVKTGMVLVAGEMRVNVWVDIETIARQVVRDIGYDRPEYGFHYDDCAVLNAMGEQSADIAQGVDRAGAGDQGLMFGYATAETSALMPMPIHFAHLLVRRHRQARRKLPWLGPDAKSQVTVRYRDGKPVDIAKIVLSTQHHSVLDGKKVRNNDPRIREAVIEEIIKPVVGKKLAANWNWKRDCHINPTGLFVVGGPKGDCGLTGRKIIVDTYGGAAPHGGGAFSGKDPTKVDRSATYALRHAAKNIVAAGLAEKCLVQAAYAIGVAKPVSVMAETYGTGKISDDKIRRLIERHFDLTPSGILRRLDLWRPIYGPTAFGGHFGRDDANFTWEKTDMVAALKG